MPKVSGRRSNSHQFKPTKRHKAPLTQTTSYYEFIKTLAELPQTSRFLYIKSLPKEEVLGYFQDLTCLILATRLLSHKKINTELFDYLNIIAGGSPSFITGLLYKKDVVSHFERVRATDDERQILKGYLPKEVLDIKPERMSIRELKEFYDNGDCVANDLSLLPSWMQRSYIAEFSGANGHSKSFFHKLFKTSYQIDEVLDVLIRTNDKRFFLNELLSYRDLSRPIREHIENKKHELEDENLEVTTVLSFSADASQFRSFSVEVELERPRQGEADRPKDREVRVTMAMSMA